MASRRLPLVLETAIPFAAGGKAEGGGRCPVPYPPNEKGESELGRASHPRGAAATGFQHLRTYGVALSAATEAHARRNQSQLVAGFFEQPSRSHSRIRLLHRSESLVPYLCTASSSSNTVGGAFCTSTLRSIQQAIGLCNNSGKHSRSRVLIVTLCSTMMPSSEMTLWTF